MSEFQELIKNFDKIRDYMRQFYVYGFKVRSDFDAKSARTYDNEMCIRDRCKRLPLLPFLLSLSLLWYFLSPLP